MIFEALGGLSNRLRAIFSRYEPGMKVVWQRYWNAPEGHFLEVFEPIPGVEFIDAVPQESSWGAVGITNDWHKNYRMLVPVRELRDRIGEIRASLGHYNAMHVRRTDLLEHCRHNSLTPTPDDDFIRWAQQKFDAPVFLATDNAETRATMLQAVGRRLVYQGPMQDSLASQATSRRFNSLADAVVDMFVCVEANEFMGSAHSSFSDIIQHVRSVQ